MKKNEPIQKVFNLGIESVKKGVSKATGAVSQMVDAREARFRAAQAAMDEAIRAQKEREKHEIEEARKKLIQLGQTSSRPDERDPLVSGAGGAIARIAKRDPRQALVLLQTIQDNAELNNDVIAEATLQSIAQHEVASQARDQLQKRPFRLGNAVGRISAALLTGDLKSAGDTLKLDGKNVYVRSPSDEIARTRLSVGKFQQGDVIAVADPHPLFDKVINFISAFAPDTAKGDRFVEAVERNFTLLGHIHVMATGRDKKYASIPVWMPHRKAQDFQDKLDDLSEPRVDVLNQFMREPEAEELAHRFATENAPPDSNTTRTSRIRRLFKKRS